jgi:hypothetical protein
VSLGLDEHAVSSSVLERVVTAAARFSSFADATAAVRMADIPLSESQVRRLAHRVGHELIAERDRRAEEHRHRRLSSRTGVTPEAVVVEVDGGRVRTRAADAGRGVHEAQNKEDKIACLATLTGPTFAADPCPEPPESFLCPRRVKRLVHQMKKTAGDANPPDNPGDSGQPADRASVPNPRERWSPVRLVRTCVASLKSSRPFGRLVATEAYERGFFGAKRRAFVGDGAAYNWAIHAGYFREFEPIVDLLHVLCYLYTSAQAGSADEASGWTRYVTWVRAVWQGRAGLVLTELDAEQERLGLPPEGTADDRTDPRRVVWEGRSYLRHNAGRMDYPRYRREGLPTTSSLVESLVGEFATRVKGKQKHWTRPAGAESILQLRAALLSEDGRLERHFAHRPGCAFRKRPRPTSSELQTAN